MNLQPSFFESNGENESNSRITEVLGNEERSSSVYVSEFQWAYDLTSETSIESSDPIISILSELSSPKPTRGYKSSSGSQSLPIAISTVSRSMERSSFSKGFVLPSEEDARICSGQKFTCQVVPADRSTECNSTSMSPDPQTSEDNAVSNSRNFYSCLEHR